MLAPTPKRLFLRYRKRGDAAALGQLFDLVAPELLALAVHLTRDVSVAEDVVQDTFLSAVESADRYDVDRPFMPWLVGVLVNRARKARERRAIQSSREHGEPPAGLGSLDSASAAPSGRGSGAPTDPAEVVASAEVVGLVGRAIDSLREPYRAVVREHLTEGLPPREIAVALERSAGTIRVQLHRGLEQLREALRPETGGSHGGAAIERLSGIGVGLTASSRLERSPSRGLDAVRESVLSGLGHGTALGVTAANSGLPTVAVLAKAALGLALVATVTTVVIRQSGTPARDVEIVRVDAPARPDLAPLRRHDLAPVSPTPPSEVRAPRSAQPAHSMPTKPVTRSKPRAERQTPKRTPRAVAAAPETFTFVVQPRILLDRVPEADAFATVTITVLDKAGQSLGSSSGLAVTLVNVPIGKFASVDDLEPELFVRADHPGAMPATVPLPYSAWGFDGVTYTASLPISVEPIRATVLVRGSPRAGAAPRSEQAGTKSQPFDGQALLVRVDPLGGLHRLDEKTLRRKGKSASVALRATRGSGTTYVLGLPKRDGEAADLIEVDPPRDGPLELVSHLRRRSLSDLQVRVVDPFDRPFKGATLIGSVPLTSIAYFEPGSDVPTSVDGWVFAKPSGMAAQYRGQVERNSGPDGLSLLPARARIEVTSSSSGKAKLEGAVPGLHEFWITTELNEKPVPLEQFPYFGPEVTAPVAGIEIRCPRELTSVKGGEAWKRAEVTVTGGGRVVNATVDALGSVKVLAPPSVPLTVSVKTRGWPAFTATIDPMAPGSRRRVTPSAPASERRR